MTINTINLGEFTDLCNVIALKFQKEDVESYFEYLGLYHWPSSEKLKVLVRSTIFGYIVSFILTLNLIAVIIETTLFVVAYMSESSVSSSRTWRTNTQRGVWNYEGPARICDCGFKAPMWVS